MTSKFFCRGLMRSCCGLWLMVVAVVLQFGAITGAQAQLPGADFDHNATGFILNAQHQTVRCETCHIKGIFKGTPKDCASCHGWNNPRSSIVMPTNHIPTASANCDVCHTAMTARFVDATLVFSHAVVAGQPCQSCHNSNNPIPNVKANPTDATHLAVLKNNTSCAQCHSTVQFAGPKIPGNHIPTAAVPCATCHVNSDYRVMPSIATIHANAPSSSSNCAQCHSSANAARYAMPSMVPPLVGPPAGHIDQGSSSCEACHVGVNSSLQLPVQDTSRFTNSAYDHAGKTRICSDCHAGTATFYGVSPKSSILSPGHIPISAGCDTCHVNSVPAGQVPLTGAASAGLVTFGNAQFSHSGIASGCVNCHGPGLGNGSFYGVTGLVVMPSTALGGHIPTTTTCESCHLGSVPAAMVPVTANRTVPGSGFLNSPPDTGHIHAGTTGACSSCHEAGMNWLSLNLPVYAMVPSSYTGVSTDLYTGFQTRPVAGGTATSVNDAGHPGGECSECHTNTVAFGQPSKPANHIPYSSNATCSACHVVWTSPPTLQAIHTYLPSGATNCAQCHSSANAAIYNAGITHAIVAPPAGHIDQGSSGCETCHVGASSSLQLPVQNGANFSNSAYDHAGKALACDACHGPGVTSGTFFHVTPKNSILSPGHIPFTLSCDSCHINSVPVGQVPLTGAASAGLTTFGNAQFSHSGITTGCDACHGGGITSSSFYGVVPRNIAQLSPGHITFNSTCETCHVSSIPSAPVSITGAGATVHFSGAAFSHTGITTGCVNCHGPNVGSNAFYGVTSLVIMPSTSLGGHIPTTTTCESCHGGSIPSALISVTAAHAVPGSGFQNSPPGTGLIHAGTTGACSTCHEAGMNWLSVNLPVYARVPAAYTGVSTDLYTGFQTRPVSGGTATSVNDALHPMSGECSQCHGNTNAFGAIAMPSNHIPFATGVGCSACHGDFSALPTITAIHANIQSTSGNCVQCHSPANAATYSAGMHNAIVTLPTQHISTGTLGCESCHVGSGSSMATTPVMDGAHFTGSLFSHANSTVTCDVCHGATVTSSTFTGVYPKTIGSLSPSHVPTTASCDTCHIGGAPSGLVPSAGMTTTFATNTKYLHASSNTGCAACHGPTLSGSSFYGIANLTVMPATTAGGHIPTSTTCESCHALSKPAGLIPASSANTIGASLFRNSPPGTDLIHTNMVGNCSSCHEAGSSWLSMDLYPMSPSSYSSNTATLYTGFQTRPVAGTVTVGNSVGDSAHPTANDCSLCHGNTQAFGTPAAPTAHIPYASGTACGACHNSFNTTPVVAPTIDKIHLHLQNPSANCEQCHSTAGAALYASTTLVNPIKTPAANHIPMGSLGCAACHVGGGSNIPGTPVPLGSHFSNSAFVHTGITTGCGECHGPNVTTGTYDGIVPKTITSLTPSHIPVSNSIGCETCHTNSIPPGLVPPTGYVGTPSFAGGQFIHTYITTGCASCHASTITSSTFYGVSSIVVMPATTNGGHIPTAITTCETCHTGSIPTGLQSVTASHVIPGSGFSRSPPDTTAIHTGITSGCTNCHEAGSGWIGMATAYPRNLTALNTTNPSQLYTGFHTRPGTSAGFSLADTGHPAAPGDCSQCHGDFNAFGQPSMPPTHIPYSANAICSSCHVSWTVPPTTQAIHTYLPSGATNCAQCHSDPNATTYSTGATRPIVKPGGTHVPMHGLGCESCHVGSASSVTSIPFSGTPTFANSAFSHSGMTSGCAECHGQSIAAGTFQGISTIVVMPPSASAASTSHLPTSTNCETCHLGSLPTAQVPGNAAHAAPGSGFMTPAPTTTMVHTGVTGGCANCHEQGMLWMSIGVPAYAPVSTPSFAGFQTRPYAGGTGTYSYNDASHPTVADGDCSNCHSGFNIWQTSVKSANHIPSGTNCASCHTGTPINYATMPTLANIHANANSASGTLGPCAQCHSTANAATYSTATMTIVAPATNHIGMAALDCAGCHVGANSSFGSLSAVGSMAQGSKFNNSAYSHAGVTSSCASCHAGVTSGTFQGGVIPVSMTAPVLSPVHVPNPSSLDCSICHTTVPAALSKIGSTSTTFAGGQFSHSGITTSCSACHGSGISGTSFKGITSIVVLPAVTPGNHIPSPVNATCETCHSGSTPSTLVSANAASLAAGSTKFYSPTPTGAAIHTSITNGCGACHETGSTWLGVSLYPKASSGTTPNVIYTGFNTRPVQSPTTGTATAFYDPSHPTGTTDCSNCHGSTVDFSAAALPSNHIPFNAGTACNLCHTNLGTGGPVSNATDFSTKPLVGPIHQYSTSYTCSSCHSAANATTFANTATSFSITSPAKTATGATVTHIPYGTVECNVCHTAAGTLNYTSFSAGQFSHTGITTGCATCHGAGITTSSYTGVTAIVAIAATTSTNGPNTHIPYTAACEVCHSGSIPTTLLSVTATGTGFASPLVSTSLIHTNSTGTCMSCHERGYQWLGMGTGASGNKYPQSPSTYTTGAAQTTPYTGFQTRPGATGVSPNGYTDPAHSTTPASSLDTADCSTCHSGTTQFTGEGKPAGHMPTTDTLCSDCHATATYPGDYSYAPATNGTFTAQRLTSLAALHTGIATGQVTYTATTLATKTCSTCHVAGTGGVSGTAPFAGCATQASCTTPPTISYQPKMMSAIAKHIPIGTVDCNGCHANFSAFGTTTKMGSIGHANVKTAAIACLSCHEAGLSWTNASVTTRPSNHSGSKAAPNDCGNSGCHSYNGGFRALLRPILRSGAVGPNASRVRPNLQNGTLSRGSLGNVFDHTGQLAGQCKTCHDGKSASGLPARHLMVSTSCDTCHRPTTWLPAQFSHTGVSANTCLACHNGMSASGKPAGHFMTSRSCDSCHKNNTVWLPVNYLHISPLYQPSPDKTTCVSCHDTNGEMVRRQLRGLSRVKPIPGGASN